jgi:hypothetical protein
MVKRLFRNKQQNETVEEAPSTEQVLEPREDDDRPMLEIPPVEDEAAHERLKAFVRDTGPGVLKVLCELPEVAKYTDYGVLRRLQWLVKLNYDSEGLGGAIPESVIASMEEFRTRYRGQLTEMKRQEQMAL